MKKNRLGLRPGATLAHYEIRKLLGRGGMGEVYLAHDRRLKRPVALKILPSEFGRNPERLARFHREATSAAALNHPNICTIYEVGEADGRTYIAMEYVEGKTLRERVSEQPMTIGEVLEVALQIADALEEARNKEIVHRDIKSANIVLTARNQVKILDFGLAKHVPTGASEASEASSEATVSHLSAGLTAMGSILGTAVYMSPEQALGLVVDHRSDLFSFGVVLYETLTARLPFAARSPQELLRALLQEDAPPIAWFNASVPLELARLVTRLLAKKPEARYQTAREAWVDLRQVQEQVKAPSASAVASPAAGARRRGWRVLAPAGLAAAITLALLLLPWPWRKTTAPTREVSPQWGRGARG